MITLVYVHICSVVWQIAKSFDCLVMFGTAVQLHEPLYNAQKFDIAVPFKLMPQAIWPPLTLAISIASHTSCTLKLNTRLATPYLVQAMHEHHITATTRAAVAQVEANQELNGVTAEGANVLPARVIEDAFQHQYNKTLNFIDLKAGLQKVDSWYTDRGIFGQVRGSILLLDMLISVSAAASQQYKTVGSLNCYSHCKCMDFEDNHTCYHTW